MAVIHRMPVVTFHAGLLGQFLRKLSGVSRQFGYIFWHRQESVVRKHHVD